MNRLFGAACGVALILAAGPAAAQSLNEWLPALTIQGARQHPGGRDFETTPAGAATAADIAAGLGTRLSRFPTAPFWGTIESGGPADGGNLVLTARKESGGHTCWNGPCQYTSARLNTAGRFTVKDVPQGRIRLMARPRDRDSNYARGVRVADASGAGTVDVGSLIALATNMPPPRAATASSVSVGAILVGARIYENSLLRMGGRVKLREALAR